MSPALRCRSLFSIHGGADDLVETGSVAEVRAKWEARMEGKGADMQDGDVVEFRHGKASGGKAVS
jgi:ribosome-binding ATPase YchF (GTP1/OBG family)